MIETLGWTLSMSPKADGRRRQPDPPSWFVPWETEYRSGTGKVLSYGDPVRVKGLGRGKFMGWRTEQYQGEPTPVATLIIKGQYRVRPISDVSKLRKH